MCIRDRGKTTLLKCICGLTIPDSGDIFWNNNPIKSNLKDFAKDESMLDDLENDLQGAGLRPTKDYVLDQKKGTLTLQNKNFKFCNSNFFLFFSDKITRGSLISSPTKFQSECFVANSIRNSPFADPISK